MSEPIRKPPPGPRRGNSSESAPTVSFREEVAGRETLAAIAASQAEARAPRAPSTTQHYGDRISNAPGAVSPRIARALDGAPEITFQLGFAGRDTQAALELEGRTLKQDRKSAPPEIEITSGEIPVPEVDLAELVIEQMHSFVVQARLEQLESSLDQRRLIDQRLLPRMPGCKMADITSIQVKAWGQNTVLFRITTRVP